MYEIVGAFTVFAFAATFTPGPNNIIATFPGATFGIRGGIGHILGVAFGFPVMAFAAGLGAHAIFSAVSWLQVVVQWLATAFLAWLAWKIATSPPPSELRGHLRPLRFHESVVFQWLNPKCWATVLAMVTIYAGSGGWELILVLSGVISLMSFCSTFTWTLFGASLSPWLEQRPWRCCS